ncbi:MAG: heme lyase CcmF/NrfE family subunit [SAR202 cluster bacterium]|nr:heme lyase CcmF/NrfE family subunit [SAR202 cluster bacterium]
MAYLGTGALLIATVLAVYGTVGGVLAVRRRDGALAVSAQRAAYMTVPAMGLAVLALVIAFIDHDFSIRYVAEHSNRAMPRIYTWVAFYAGNEGSLLFVAFALAAFAGISMAMVTRRIGSQRTYANAVLMALLTFFLIVLLTLANPFEQLAVAAVDGQGINPLLKHPGMFIHPPLIMTGLISVSVPFALAMGALLSGRIDDDWVDAGRVWGLVAWAMLGTGLLLGAWWAYTILGWGGYWAWDPVENAALMPWLGLTAFIHSIMVQKRRGMFRMWNIALINISFALGNFGVFINRGGPVPSVHSFGASTLGWVFLAFLGVTLVLSFGAFFWRMGLLKSARPLESMLSREASFLVNNLLLLAIAFITMFGVVFPLIAQLFVGRELSIARPYYDAVNGPLLLALLALMGIGPLLPWRTASWAAVRKVVVVPGAAAGAVLAVLLIAGMRGVPALVGFGVSAFVAASVLQEWARGTVARSRQARVALPIAFTQLMAANRPRYGGYVVHLAIVLLAFGIVGSSFFDLEKDVVLRTGERAALGDYEVEFVRVDTTNFADRTERVATVNVYRDGQFLTSMGAWQGFYPSFQMISTRSAIRSTPKEDLYVLFSEVQSDGQSAVFRILVNPLVWWMWLSGPVLILGTVIALWPARERAMAYVPSPARRPGDPQPGGAA